MGNSRALVPLLLSVVIAVGGSYFLYQWVKTKTRPDKMVTVKDTAAFPAVVAKTDIPWGTRLTSEMLTTKPYLEESLPKGHFPKPEDAVNRIVVSQLREGEPVVEHRLAPLSLETGGVSAVLDPGMRAISVKGNRVLGLAGFINPGNRVDVLVTIDDPKNKEPVTKIVLENLKVLASGTQIIENSKGEPAPVDVYTLAVTSEQGERLTLAATEGRLQFALRGAADTDVVLTKGITVPELLKSMLIADTSEKTAVKPVRKVRYTRPASNNRKATVEVIKGVELSRKEITISTTK